MDANLYIKLLSKRWGCSLISKVLDCQSRECECKSRHPRQLKGGKMQKDKIRISDSVYVRSQGWISNLIAKVTTGGKDKNNCPSHEARVFSIKDGKILLIEVVFGGKRYIDLDNYLKREGTRVWIKRDKHLLVGKDNGINETMVKELLAYLENAKVTGYDWQLFFGLGIRGILRKVFRSRKKFNWVTKILDSRMRFVCSEFQNYGRRFIGQNVKENETPADDMRKIEARMITSNV